MPIFGTSGVGRVIAVLPSVGAAVPITIRMQTQTAGGGQAWRPGGTGMILSGFDLRQGTNSQYLPTVGGATHRYLLGDTMGQLKLSGLSGDLGCTPAAANAGIDKVLQAFRQYRVTAAGRPVKVTLGTEIITADLLDVTANLPDPALPLIHWTFALASYPL